MPKIKVLIAEDHAVVREGLKILIGTEPDFVVAGEADNGVNAVQMAKELNPDVVLMDAAMPQCGGLEATKTIRQQNPASKILVLSGYADGDLAHRMLEAGASGYLTKHSAADELLHAIREVQQGGCFLSRQIVEQLRRRKQTSFLRGRHSAEKEELTPRQTEVLRLVARGLPNKQIAAETGLSIKTVEKHRQAAMDKLNLHERAALTRYAVQRGLVPVADSPAS